ncbi:MAG: hypothetical protein ABR529_10625 [Actinomycetota bacterium]
MGFRELPHAVGRGLFAGVVGTAAITASTMIQMKIRDQGPSSAPAEATEELLNVHPDSEEDRQRLSSVVHWGYGTMWGAARGVIGAFGGRGATATALHFGAVWGNALWMLPTLRVAAPVTEWGGKEVAIDGFNHLIYALATNLAYERMSS